MLKPTRSSNQGGYELASDNAVTWWMQLLGVTDGRAILQVEGGLVSVNVANPRRPKAESFLPIRHWRPDLTLEGTDVVTASWYYGIDQYDLDDPSLRIERSRQ